MDLDDECGRYGQSGAVQSISECHFRPADGSIIANQRTAGGRKDSVVNAESQGEFVWNMATYALRDAVNITSEEFEHGIDEFERAELKKTPSRLVRPPRVAASPIQFECRHLQTLRLPGDSEVGTVDIVFGRVIAIHIADEALSGGRIDIARIRPYFRRRGGRLIVPHGGSDPIFSINDTIAWWRKVDAANHGEAASFVRVFAVPGMNHCAGGPATDQYDALSAVADWVEKGTVPERIPAKAGPKSPWAGRTRPLCPYPKFAHYRSGDVNQADSFACEDP